MCVCVFGVCVHVCLPVHSAYVYTWINKGCPFSNFKYQVFFFCIISSALKVSTSDDENDPILLAVKTNRARVNRYDYTVV